MLLFCRLFPMLHVFLYYRMCSLLNNNGFLFTSTNQSGAVLFRIGHHDLLRISIPGRFQCFCHSSYFEPLCSSIQHLFTLFSPAAFSLDHSIQLTQDIPVSPFLLNGQKRLPGFYFSIYE